MTIPEGAQAYHESRGRQPAHEHPDSTRVTAMTRGQLMYAANRGDQEALARLASLAEPQGEE